MGSSKLEVRGKEVAAYSATEAKNAFGEVLDRALADGVVAITKHDKVRAVVLSPDTYEALTRRAREPLEQLRAEFDQLVAAMGTPQAVSAGRALFEASGEELGAAAVAAARKRV